MGAFAMPLGVKGWALAIGKKPEFWFQIWLWFTKYDVVRIPVLVLCALLNIHGITMALFVQKPKIGDINNFSKMIGESDPEMKAKLEKFGLFPKTTSAKEPLMNVVCDNA